MARLSQDGLPTLRPPRPDRPRSVEGVESTPITQKDIVAGLLRLTVPQALEDAAGPNGKAANGAAPETPKAKRTLRPSLGPLRIGAGPGGATEVRAHQWFKGFNFDSLLSGSMPAPYIPNLRGCEDDANFGPIDWRGEPVLTSPEYDVDMWEALWDEGNW